eukprot:m.712644 g.712644  ORF g.712644 m.712644 type:complete len:94 (+) comp22964_c0_seq9:291-572(+)
MPNNISPTLLTRVKAVFDHDIRRFSVQGQPPSYQDLMDSLRRRCVENPRFQKILPIDISISWIDDDGDNVAILGDEDLLEYVLYLLAVNSGIL